MPFPSLRKWPSNAFKYTVTAVKLIGTSTIPGSDFIFQHLFWVRHGFLLHQSQTQVSVATGRAAAASDGALMGGWGAQVVLTLTSIIRIFILKSINEFTWIYGSVTDCRGFIQNQPGSKGQMIPKSLLPKMTPASPGSWWCRARRHHCAHRM